MKRIVLFYLLSIVLITGNSCKKFLEVSPEDGISPVNYYQTEKDLEAAIAAVYDRLQDNSLYGTPLWSYFHFSDEFFFNGASTGLRANIMDASSTAGLFERCYVGVERANLLLDNIDNASVADSVRNNIKGEALFLRGYYYFLLVDYFGGIPLRLTPTISPTDDLLPRSSVKEVYDQIVADMKTSIGLLKGISSYSYNGRITKTAAQGILARVYLTMAGAPLRDVSQYENARAMTDSIIQSGLHDLNPDYSNIFINHARDLYDTRECLFEVEFQGNSTGVFKEGGTLGQYMGIRNTQDIELGYAADNIRTQGKLFNSYDPRDCRRDWAIAPYYFTGNPAIKTFWSASQIYDRNGGKWRREYEVFKPRGRDYTPINFPLLRYSDVLLMYAEADNELRGPQPAAIEYVNRVRKRGWGERVKSVTVTNGGAGYTAAPTVTISGGGRPTGDAQNIFARAVAVVSNGVVTAINLIDPGIYYTSVPAITISAPANGTTATAVVELTTGNAVQAVLPAEAVSGKEAFREEIRNERYRELAFEGIRKHDLLRWGIYSETMEALDFDVKASAPTTYRASASIAASYGKQPKYLLFPIPTSELNLNRKITQNPGW